MKLLSICILLLSINSNAETVTKIDDTNIGISTTSQRKMSLKSLEMQAVQLQAQLDAVNSLIKQAKDLGVVDSVQPQPLPPTQPPVTLK